MSVLARGQIGLTDITDAYSINLSVDSFTFQGDTTKVKSTQSFATQVTAYRGATPVSAAVTVSTTLTNTGLTVTDDGDSTSPTLTVQATTTLTDAILRGSGLNGQILLSILVDGKATFNKAINLSIALTGATGAGAYNCLLGNEAITIACDKDGKTLAASSVTVPFTIYQGTSRKTASVTVSGLPTGITTGTNTDGTTSADGSLTLNIAASSNLGGTSSGEITLTFKTGSTTIGTKKLSWAKSITGATGATGGTGPTGPGAINVICGNEAASIPCTTGGLVASAMTITIPFAGYQGTSRVACTLTKPTVPSGMTAGNPTNATTSADGSITISVAANGTLGGASTMSGEFNGDVFIDCMPGKMTLSCSKKNLSATFTKDIPAEPGKWASYKVSLTTKVKPEDVDPGMLLAVEPEDYSKSEIAALKAKGATVLGYLSAGSVSDERGYYKKLKPYVMGPVEDWPHEGYLDLRRTAVRDWCISRAKEVKAQGCDGWWIDNLDVYEEYKSPAMYEAAGMVLSKVKALGGYVMVNGGMEYLEKAMEAGCGNVDGVTLEEVFSRIINYNGSGEFGRQEAGQSEKGQEFLCRCLRYGMGAFLLEYTLDNVLKLRIRAFCTDKGMSGCCISGDVNL